MKFWKDLHKIYNLNRYNTDQNYILNIFEREKNKTLNLNIWKMIVAFAQYKICFTQIFSFYKFSLYSNY